MISTISRPRPNQRTALLRSAILGGCLFAFGGYAHAHTFCVYNTNQLRAALAASGDGGAYASEDDTIYISGGTHHTHGTEFFYSSTDPHTLNIIGMGTQTCEVTLQKAILTRLDGDGKSRVFETHSTQGAVLFQYLTIQNGRVGPNESGGGLSMNSHAGDNGQPLVSLVIFRGNHAGFGGGFAIGNGGNFGIDFQNNLVAGNSADYNDGAGEIVYSGVDGYGTRIVSNTFVGNTVGHQPANAIGGLYLQTATGDTLSNNIFWHNSGYDLDSGGAALLDNDYGSDASTPGPGSSGNLQVNPQFVGPANFRLSATSPLLGIGALNPPGAYISGIDIRAKPRVVNDKIDLGAYERQQSDSGIAPENDAEDGDDAE